MEINEKKIKLPPPPPPPPPRNEKCKSDKEYIKKKGYVAVKKEYYDSKTEDTHYKQRYLCKANNQYSYYLKRKEVTPDPNDNSDDNVSPEPVNTKYQDCTGKKTRFKGCRDTDGIISKVQGCIGVKQDGYFGSNTESALQVKTGKKVFTTDEVDTICKTSSEKINDLPFDEKQQLNYWNTLKSEGRIYSQGIVKTLSKSGTVVYIIKKRKDGTKVPLSSSSEINTSDEFIKSFDEFDYIALFPINPKGTAKKGEIAILTAWLDNDDKPYVKIMKDQNGFWSPTEKEEGFKSDGLPEGYIKNTLRRKLSEQVVSTRLSSSSKPGVVSYSKSTSSNVDSQGSTTTSQGSTTGGGTSFDSNVETEKVMTPKKQEILSLMDKLISYTSVNGGFGKSMKVSEFKKAKSEIENINIKDVCKPEQQKELESARQDLVNKMKKYDDQLDEIEESYMNKINTILGTISSECKTIETKSLNSKTTTSNTNLGTTSSVASKPELKSTSVNSTNPELAPTSELKQDDQTNKTPDCSNSQQMLVDYLIDGLQGIKLDTTQISKKQMDLCYCYKTGSFNDMNARKKIGDLFKNKINLKSQDELKNKVAPEKQLFRPLFNRQLGWNEIQKLIKGEDVFNVKINTLYRDRNFGSEYCKSIPVTESLKNRISSHILETIRNKKKTIKENRTINILKKRLR
jgi:hypothetical protein